MTIDYQGYATKHKLLIGAGVESPNAFCLLWKNQKKLPPLAEVKGDFSMMGNLYTTRGISLMLKGLYLFPNIRRLIVTGLDFQNTGAALLQLWQEGLNDDNEIANLGIRIDSSLGPELVNHLRDSVELIDERDEKDILKLIDKHRATSADLPPHGEPRVFPAEKTPPPPDTTPSFGTGRVIHAPKVVHAWVQALDQVMRFGIEKNSDHQAKQRELLNVLVVVSDEDPNDPYLPSSVVSNLHFSREQIQDYCDSMVFDEASAEQLKKEYYPGRRLREHAQIPAVIDLLREAPHSRRAVASLWDRERDLGSEAPPCITEVQFHITGNKLYMRHSARAQDVLKCMVPDLLGCRALQKRVADRLGLEMGPLTALLGSAHVYGDDREQTLATIERFSGWLKRLDFDPIGDFLITLDDGEILVRLLGRDGETILWETRGTSAQDLGYQIAHLGLTTYPSHLAYVVRELTLAEVALARGEEFVQDKA